MKPLSLGTSSSTPPASSNSNVKTIRILLVDDNSMLREGFRLLIEMDPQLQIVGQAANGEEALIQARRLLPDVVIMDINMPKMNGIEATRRLCRELPSVAVIGLSIHDHTGLVKSMLNTGAARYLTKDGSVEELVQAIHEVYEQFRAPSAAAKVS